MRRLITFLVAVIAAVTLTTTAGARTDSGPYRQLAVHHHVRHHALPPHRRLWSCIHRVEGPWHDKSRPYMGGLQMHWNWGYGIRGDAGDYTKAQQEWAAERGYRHGGVPFLYQQWFKWDGATYCLRYA